jgi:hypothetical protein
VSISTRNLAGLPDVDRLRRLMQSLAVLDAILSPEWESRYSSFDSRWAQGQQLGSLRNGAGDHYSALFSSAGCWLKGFAHEAELSPFMQDPPGVVAGMFDGLPAEFAACLSEPAFAIEETTFCLWRTTGDPSWRRGTLPVPADRDADGSADLLWLLDGRAETYVTWAEDYFEREVPLTAVRAVYDHAVVDADLLAELTDDVELGELQSDLLEIGYPAS